MKVAAISDVHVTPHHTELKASLLRFLTHPLVGQCDHVLLLGDIFDVMVGNHRQYLVEYELFLQQMAKMLSQGTEIYYCEGNHDFHLGKLFANCFSQLDQASQARFHLFRQGEFLEIQGKYFFITHGDELEVDKKGHQRYRSVMNSLVMQIVANYLVPYWFVKKIGQFASSTSRELNRLQYQSPELQTAIRDQFRQHAFRLKSQFPQLNYLLCGHSHIQDYWQYQDFAYLNNGFFPFSQSFIYLNNQQIEFIPL